MDNFVISERADAMIAKFVASLPTSAQATAKVQQWQPIETAPKDNRILLGWVVGIFTGINCVIGRWNNDSYAKKPRPYWTHDLERLTTVYGTRSNQPTHWMPLPEPPEAIREEQEYRSSEKS